jgi:hypothetical protein
MPAGLEYIRSRPEHGATPHSLGISAFFQQAAHDL